MKAMILTVGTGTRPDANIVSPLVKSIRNSNPNLVVFACSRESRKIADQIAQELGLVEGESCLFSELRNHDDLELSFEDIVRAFLTLSKLGYHDHDIEIDFTTGTKAMTSALVLAGVAFKCFTLKYIAGERKHGVVISGKERIITFQPNRILAFNSIDQAVSLIRDLRFDTAIEVLENTDAELLDDTYRKKRGVLLELARAYSLWDKFNHRKARGRLGKAKKLWIEISEEFKVLGEFIPDEKVLSKLIGISESIDKGVITWDIMADLFCNARRRFDEGKYDDALARIYRLTEMLAQKVLRDEYNIDTSDVNLSLVPHDLHESLKTLGGKEGKISIGLVRDYEILNSLDNELGNYYMENRGFRGILSVRNQSILAHGLEPVNRSGCEKAFEHFSEMMEIACPNFSELCEFLTFPWRRGGRTG